MTRLPTGAVPPAAALCWLSTVGALRAVRDLLLEQPDTRLYVIAYAINAWIRDGGDFSQALGLPHGWRAMHRRELRDAALIDLVRRRFPEMEGRAAARAVAAAGRRYEGGAWPRDRRAERRPDGLNGDFFDILSLGELPSYGTLRALFNGLSGANGPVVMRQRGGDAA